MMLHARLRNQRDVAAQFLVTLRDDARVLIPRHDLVRIAVDVEQRHLRRRKWWAAGNVNTLLTLWPVDDEATADFMAHLFQRLAAGDTPVQALSATRRFFMQHPQWSAPRYWAPFVLYGPGPDGSTAAGVR